MQSIPQKFISTVCYKLTIVSSFSDEGRSLPAEPCTKYADTHVLVNAANPLVRQHKHCILSNCLKFKHEE